jgi:tellurite resistance protein TerC
MDSLTLLYVVFVATVTVALVVDLGFLSKSNHKITIATALKETALWVSLAFAFCGFILYVNHNGAGKADAIQFISAYLLEWSLSIDNIFVFIIIFAFFKVDEVSIPRALLLGILMAIVFRILFIAVGSAVVAKYAWVMFIFGAFLLYTGIKMFAQHDEEEFNPEENWAFKFMRKYMRTTDEEPQGRFIIYRNHKAFFTKLAMVVVMLGLIDIVFAIDSIPAVFSVIPDPNKKLLIYSSNIFAVLGLRSLFFLLKGAANKFDYLQQGIAIVLVFVGAKMLLPLLQYAGVDKHYLHVPVWLSLVVIVFCISGSILYSIYNKRKGIPH